MQRLCGRVASVIDGLLTEWTVVERLIDSCDPAECLMAIRLLEQWGLVTRFSRDGGIFLNWRDESTATIAPKLLALLDGRVDRIAQLGAEHGCPAHAIAVLPSRDEHASGNAHRHACVRWHRAKARPWGLPFSEALPRPPKGICAAHRGDEAAERTMLARAGERVIPPGDLLLYSDAQYQSRKAWNLHHRGKNRVPPPIDPRHALIWVEVQAIHDGATWRVPAAYCYLHYRWRAGEPQFCEADTNGCAVDRP